MTDSCVCVRVCVSVRPCLRSDTTRQVHTEEMGLCQTGDPRGETTYQFDQVNLHYMACHTYSPAKQLKTRFDIRALADEASALHVLRQTCSDRCLTTRDS